MVSRSRQGFLTPRLGRGHSGLLPWAPRSGHQSPAATRGSRFPGSREKGPAALHRPVS